MGGVSRKEIGSDTNLFPRDRDWALANLDGLKMVVTRVPWPQYVGFDSTFPAPSALPGAAGYWIDGSFSDSGLGGLGGGGPGTHEESPGRGHRGGGAPSASVPTTTPVGFEITRGLKNREEIGWWTSPGSSTSCRPNPWKSYATDEKELAVFHRLPEDRLLVDHLSQVGVRGGP